jgi:EAL domain-containing protein (putative c-di-GMP-specific phosphodiesterase class I)
MLAVHDAGAGYAGVRHILELRPELVRLGISLVRAIAESLDPGGHGR